MQKITPNLWFDTQAKEAAEFYVSIFPDSKITNITTLHNTPSGDADIVSFELSGQPFMSISAGPLFKLNPSISFILNFDPSRDKNARKNLDAMWEKLSKGGVALMPIDKYPFSERYGWIADKYGVTWQLILTDPKGEERPFIVPSLMFTQQGAGKAEKAIDFYVSVFKGGKRGITARYTSGMEPSKEGTIMFADFKINNQWFAAMDAFGPHEFIFNEAISLIILCEDQKKIDYFWAKLSAVPESEQCGWLKDKFGVSWQVTATEMTKMMEKGTEEQIDRVTQAFLPMKKFDIAKLKKAYEGK